MTEARPPSALLSVPDIGLASGWPKPAPNSYLGEYFLRKNMHTLCSIITVRKISKIDATRCHILELKCTFSEGRENEKGRGKIGKRRDKKD